MKFKNRQFEREHTWDEAKQDQKGERQLGKRNFLFEGKRK